MLNVKSLKYLSNLTLPDRITKSLLHLHKKKKPPSISAQFQVSHVRDFWGKMPMATVIIMRRRVRNSPSSWECNLS